MKSKYFKPYELVSKEDYENMTEDKIFEIFDDSIIKAIDTLKEYFPKGSIYINNWYWGMERNWSGLRTPKSPNYSLTSMHPYGKAVDMIFTSYSSEEVRKFIIDNPELFPGIKGIELGISWVHIDSRSRKSIIKFKP